MSALKNDLLVMHHLLDVALHEPHGEAVLEARGLIDEILGRHVRDELPTGPTDGDHFNRPDTYEEVKQRLADLKAEIAAERIVDGPGGIFDRGGQ